MHFVSSFCTGGPGEKRQISTAWCLLSASCLIPNWAASTGPNSEPWLACTRRQTRVSTNTSVLSLPCAGGSVAYHQGRAVSLIHTHLSGPHAYTVSSSSDICTMCMHAIIAHLLLCKIRQPLSNSFINDEEVP